MLTSLLVLCVVSACSVCCVWAWLRWRRVSQYWRSRDVPHQRPHPVWGSLTFLGKENMGTWMRRMYDQFPGPYFGIWLFWRPVLVINSPELARRVLVTDYNVFNNRLVGSGKYDPIGALNLFTVNDPVYSMVKRYMSPQFTSAKLRALHTLVSTKTSELVERLNYEIKINDAVNIRSVYTDYTTDIIGRSVFGVANNAILYGERPISVITGDMLKYSPFRAISLICIFFFPELAEIFRAQYFSKSSVENVRSVFRQVAAQRGGYDQHIEECKDLFDALMKMKQDAAKDGEDISEDLLIAQAMAFLLGGFDSSAVGMTMATYELAYDATAQEKLYNELREAKDRTGNGEFDANSLAELPYLNAVIKETLRKHTPLGWIDRVASVDYQLDENLMISAGTPIYVNGNGMHFDPQYYPNPENFDPERFLTENARNLTPFTFMPFGEGPKKCLGQRFAYQTLRHGLAAVVLNFKVVPLPGAPRPADVPAAKRAMFLMPGVPLHAQFIPRFD